MGPRNVVNFREVITITSSLGRSVTNQNGNGIFLIAQEFEVESKMLTSTRSNCEVSSFPPSAPAPSSGSSSNCCDVSTCERCGWAASRKRLETENAELRVALDAALTRGLLADAQLAAATAAAQRLYGGGGKNDAFAGSSESSVVEWSSTISAPTPRACTVVIGEGAGQCLRCSSDHEDYPAEELLGTHANGGDVDSGGGGGGGAWLSASPVEAGAVEWIELGAAKPFVLRRIVFTGGVTYLHRIFAAKRKRRSKDRHGGWIEIMPWSTIDPVTPMSIDVLKDGSSLRELGVVQDIRIAVKLVSSAYGPQHVGVSCPFSVEGYATAT